MNGSTSKSPPSPEEVISAISRRFTNFTHYNKQRLYIMKQLAPKERYDLLNAIPLLYHINNHRAPGYVPDMGPNPGVYGFKLNDDIRNLRREFISKNFIASVGAVEEPLILSIASIGSAGTLAQTEKSDFDLWITVRDEVTPKEWRLLEQKGKAIKKWLISQDPDIDVNFYLGTPERIRNHNFGAVSDDSAGSALGKLLKEEFYRTCVVWAGKIPFFWMLPDELREPPDYELWWKHFNYTRLPFKDDIMDLGPLERATWSQFLASVLWQTNKSLGSPFKSLLKLTVIDAYSRNPGAELLAERVRHNVEVNPTHGNATDPYLCLFEFAANSMRDMGDDNGVRLLGEMFYLKTLGATDGLRISLAGVDFTLNRKRNEVREYLRAYGIGADAMRDLENINYWGFRRGLEYRAEVQAFVKRIYDRVLGSLRAVGISLENGRVVPLKPDADRDAMTLLQEFSTISDKVDCFYGRAIPKVQPIPPSFRKMLHQKGYALLFDPDQPSGRRWTIAEEVPLGASGSLKFMPDGAALPEGGEELPPEAMEVPGEITEEMLDQEPYEEVLQSENIISGRSALALIGWLALNKMAHQRTLFRVKLGSKSRPVRELRHLLWLFRLNFAHPLYDDQFPESEFRNPALPAKALISFDFPSHTHFREEQDRDRRGAAAESTAGIRRIAIAEQDTYGILRVRTVDARRFTPGHLMARLLNRHLAHATKELPDRVFFHSADQQWLDGYKNAFQQVLIVLHATLKKMNPPQGLTIRHVTKIADAYCLVERPGTGEPIRGRSMESIVDLIHALERPCGGLVQTVIDPGIQGPERLREMLKKWVPGQVQIFVRKAMPTSSIHVIDEAGCFFNERVDTVTLDYHLRAMATFLMTLGQTPLAFAANKDGRMKLALQEILNVAESEKQFNYRLGKWAGSGLTPANPRLLSVRLSGSLDLRDPHDLSLVADGRSEEGHTSAGNTIADLAGMIGTLMREWDCTDFTIIETRQTKGPPRFRQSIEYLSFRRAVDRAVRKQIGQKTGAPILPPPSRQLGATRIIEDWRN